MKAGQRCDQENLISQLKGQVRALCALVNTLVGNLATWSWPPSPGA